MVVEPCVEDFFSMPPALRRKLFSNLERFRLEQLRLAQAQRLSDLNNHPSRAACGSSGSPRPSFTHSGSSTTATTPAASTLVCQGRHGAAYTRPRLSLRKRRVQFLSKARSPVRRLQKQKPIEPPYFVTEAESEWFRALPAKIQQSHFSPEERARLAGTWCRPTSVILDSADKALYRRGGQQRKPSVTSISSAPTLSSDTSLSTMAPSEHAVDSAVDTDSVYHSFRWLDEEDELDLRLDDYHNHLTDLSSTKKHSRRPSFRRTLSFNSFHTNGRSTPSSIPPLSRRSLTTSRLSLSPIPRHKQSSSRSFFSTSVFKHPPAQPSTPLDQPAQYYQDPEARLKLRVYLASPQKFDEAVEFGFPSLELRHDKENHSPHRPSTEGRPWRDDDANAARHGDRGSFFDDPATSLDSASQLHSQPPPSITPRSRLSQHLSGNREMTLKMTLTRADLRTVESSSMRTSGVSDRDDPLRLADLPPVGGNGPVWEVPEQPGMVKKMWWKLKGHR
ncbi:hypothetical protein VTO42DRAFT_6522 [Malbranchea cinnamomea]